MKKYIIIILMIILAVSLYSCGQTDENVFYQNTNVVTDAGDITTDISDTFNYDENDSGQEIQVDKSKIVISDEAKFSEYESWFPPVPPNSYAVTKTQTYDEKWIRVYAAYYPKFTDEIKYAGSDAIKQYYAQKVEKDKEYINSDEWGIGDTVIDELFDYYYYDYSTYDTKFFGKYLSVRYFDAWYGGGIHGEEFYTVDNFDMETGKLLTLNDLFGNEEMYRPILQELICKNLMLQYTEETFFMNPYKNSDIMNYIDNSRFRITDGGIEFIFQEYEIACYAAGTIFVIVPYDELSDILQIQIN